MAKQKRAKKGATPIPPEIPPSKWRELQDLISQSEGQPLIALATDPRPALNKADGFEDVPLPGEDLANLFGE